MNPRTTYKLTALATLLFLAGLPACSDDDDPVVPGSGATTVGPSGATVTGGGGNVELVFPQGAVDSEIGVTSNPASSPPRDTGMVLNRAYESGPGGTRFLVPAGSPADRQLVRDLHQRERVRFRQLPGGLVRGIDARLRNNA